MAGNRIRELRELNRWSQRDLGAMLGVGGPAVHKLEVGQRRLTQDYITRLCKLFGCSPDDVMGSACQHASMRAEDATLAALLRLEALMVEQNDLLRELVGRKGTRAA